MKTEAIVVWDIENNRVPSQLVPRCFEIVQWLLQVNTQSTGVLTADHSKTVMHKSIAALSTQHNTFYHVPQTANAAPTRTCCGWLLQEIQEQSPDSTVLRVYVAGTFDKYPAQLKKALCTHPRVQLLYSIGKVSLTHSFFLTEGLALSRSV